MEWNYGEQETKKKEMAFSSKILLSIIIFLIVLIIAIIILLINVKKSIFTIYVDGSTVTSTTKENLLTTINGETYFNIEEFAKIVKYEYHDGEYKSLVIENDKCFVQGTEETASFYINENKVYKLPINKLEEEYSEYQVSDTIQKINGKIYAPIEAIKVAFNVVTDSSENSFQIYTLNYLEKVYDTRVKKWGYNSISKQSFENKKAILYGCLIVNKGEGQYKVINLDNTREIIPAKYTSIEFLENMQDFIVTNSLEQVGILDIEGRSQVEPIYDSISLLDKENNLYIISRGEKYGVIKSGNITVIYPEYDKIGLDSNSVNNKYLILDTLIPVCKEEKWGAYNKQGVLVLGLEYDELGYNMASIDFDGIKESVEPVLAIERCNGVVVRKENKYGLISTTGKELVPIDVDSIYAIPKEDDEDSKYYMLYNGKKLNVIERLIKADLISKSTNAIN